MDFKQFYSKLYESNLNEAPSSRRNAQTGKYTQKLLDYIESELISVDFITVDLVPLPGNGWSDFYDALFTIKLDEYESKKVFEFKVNSRGIYIKIGKEYVNVKIFEYDPKELGETFLHALDGSKAAELKLNLIVQEFKEKNPDLFKSDEIEEYEDDYTRDYEDSYEEY